MTEVERPTLRRRSPLWMRALLVVSLAVNLVLGGIALGRIIKMREAAEVGRFNARVLSMMPREHRAEAREIMLGEVMRDGSRRGRRRWPDVDAVIDALRAEPFDPAAYRAALDDLREVFESRVAARMEGVAVLGESLGPEARRALADGLERRAERRRAQIGGE